MADPSTSAVPEDANEHCPGVNAPGAGKADACAGCPNQATCADTEATTAAAAAAAADAAAVAARLAGVKAVLLVLSGKGGVGKSTLAAQLALALAGRGRAVGLVDLDVCGPSAPGMAGVGGRDVHASGSGWAPVYADEDAFGGAGGGGGGSLAVMSIGFLLPDPDGAVVWRGPRKHALITKFFRDVDWGALDVLVVDTPPGTSDEHMAAAALLLGGGGGAAGGAATGAAALPASPGPPRISALIVTTPQEVALADVRKEVSFCKKVNLPILGVVENMAALATPAAALSFTDTSGGDATPAVAAAVDAALGAGAWGRLAATAPLFYTEGSSGGEALAAGAGAPFLGRVPLDPAMGRATEEGRAVGKGGPAGGALGKVVTRVLVELGMGV